MSNYERRGDYGRNDYGRDNYGGHRDGYRGNRGSRGGRGGRDRRSRGGYQPTTTEYRDNPDFKANWEERIDDFDQMELKPDLLHGIYSYGFKVPSDIQALAIKPIKQGRNVIAQAQSGTGKTGAFSIGILENINTDEKLTQAIVLTPTHELADQTYTFFSSIGNRMNGLTIAEFIGGSPKEENQKQAQEHPHVVVATPGRALDLIKNGYLRCENLKVACLDEADLLLEQNFLSQTQEIFEYFQQNIQILLFSATIPEPIFTLMTNFMQDPVKILVKPERLTLEGIRQFYVNVEQEKYKFPTLLDIYGQLSIQKAVIFANRKETVDFLQKEFQAANFEVSAIHAGLTQVERQRVMHEFRCGNSRVLAATDIIARGIDVQQITLVINFETPLSIENYLHRIGRSGRYGREGVAINICSATEMQTIEQIKRVYHTTIDELPENFAEILEQANSTV